MLPLYVVLMVYVLGVLHLWQRYPLFEVSGVPFASGGCGKGPVSFLLDGLKCRCCTCSLPRRRPWHCCSLSCPAQYHIQRWLIDGVINNLAIKMQASALIALSCRRSCICSHQWTLHQEHSKHSTTRQVLDSCTKYMCELCMSMMEHNSMAEGQ